jgi:hypothetical protein
MRLTFALPDQGSAQRQTSIPERRLRLADGGLPVLTKVWLQNDPEKPMVILQVPKSLLCRTSEDVNGT